jgi:general stress protein 26
MQAQTDTTDFWDRIAKYDTCMVVTHDGSRLRARPMAPKLSELAAGSLLFLTERPTAKTQEVEADHEVACTFSRHGEYLSLSGRARVSGDRALIDSVWDAEAAAWLPEDRNDPTVALLVVEPEMAEIWDVKANAVTRAYEFAKAAVGGKDRPDTTENRKIEF